MARHFIIAWRCALSWTVRRAGSSLEHAEYFIHVRFDGVPPDRVCSGMLVVYGRKLLVNCRALSCCVAGQKEEEKKLN